MDEPVCPVLMLEAIESQRSPAMPVYAQHTFDEHLREIVEHPSVLHLDPGRRQRVPLRRTHLQHARSVKTLCFEGELPQFNFRKERAQGDWLIFTRQPLLPFQKLPQVSQRWASCLLLERVPARLTRLRGGRIRKQHVARNAPLGRDPVLASALQPAIDLCSSALCLL